MCNLACKCYDVLDAGVPSDQGVRPAADGAPKIDTTCNISIEAMHGGWVVKAATWKLDTFGESKDSFQRIARTREELGGALLDAMAFV